MRATYKRSENGYWKAAVVDAKGKPVCICVHFHRNRDMDSWEYRVRGYLDGEAALSCASKLLAKIETR